MAGSSRISRLYGAVSIGSFRVSAMIAGLTETGEMMVLGSGHRASQGIRRGYVTDMAAATYAARDSIERAEKAAGISISKVWVGCSGAGLSSRISPVEIDIGGRRIEDADVQRLLASARDCIQPDGRIVLHAQPASYTLDGAHGVANPKGLHAERLGMDVHVMLADGAPLRNITEAVQNAHLEVEAVVASPVAAGHACLSAEERDLGVALIEIGAGITNISVYAAGLLLEMVSVPLGSGDITDAIASTFGIRRFQAERLKCVSGSAIASRTDHREMIPLHGPGEDMPGGHAPGADDRNRIPRAELIAVITAELDRLIEEINKAFKSMGAAGQHCRQVVLTGGGAELAGLADYMQTALGRPVRIGRPAHLAGLPEAHGVPGFATLAGLVLYAADDPVDVRTAASLYQTGAHYGSTGLIRRVFGAFKAYF